MNLKCSAPTTLGKCTKFQIHRTEPALGQRRDFAWVPGHNLQFSSGVLAEQMVISKPKIRGRSKEVTGAATGAIREFVNQLFNS